MEKAHSTTSEPCWDIEQGGEERTDDDERNWTCMSGKKQDDRWRNDRGSSRSTNCIQQHLYVRMSERTTNGMRRIVNFFGCWGCFLYM